MSWRNERKYIVDFRQLNDVYSWIHQRAFVKTYPDRKVNNCYFDTINLDCFFENHDGQSNRRKYRLRWYGNTENWRTSIFEEKIKNNDVNRKQYHKIDSTKFQQFREFYDYPFFIKNNLIPTVINNYKREYFSISGTEIRLTIDQKLRYYYPKNDILEILPSAFFPKVIIEIKSNKMNDVSNLDFMFPLTKMGKYVDGVTRLYL